MQYRSYFGDNHFKDEFYKGRKKVSGVHCKKKQKLKPRYSIQKKAVMSKFADDYNIKFNVFLSDKRPDDRNTICIKIDFVYYEKSCVLLLIINFSQKQHDYLIKIEKNIKFKVEEFDKVLKEDKFIEIGESCSKNIKAIYYNILKSDDKRINDYCKEREFI